MEKRGELGKMIEGRSSWLTGGLTLIMRCGLVRGLTCDIRVRVLLWTWGEFVIRKVYEMEDNDVWVVGRSGLDAY